MRRLHVEEYLIEGGESEESYFERGAGEARTFMSGTTERNCEANEATWSCPFFCRWERNTWYRDESIG